MLTQGVQSTYGVAFVSTAVAIVKPEIRMELEEEISRLRKENYTESYAMSIGELIRLYENEELDIHPKFQRILRWTSEQKSKLIESILLRIPIPPIFVAPGCRGTLGRCSTAFSV